MAEHATFDEMGERFRKSRTNSPDHENVRPRIALTGGIATGKSFVADVFASLGATIIDADVLAREVVEPGTDGLARIVERFGAGVLTPDGSLDRPRLGRLIFADDAARADLNAIVHPLVRARAVELAEGAPEGSVVIQVIPLLVEAGLDGQFDRIIVIDAPAEIQLERLMHRDALSRDEALTRIRAQTSRQERLAVASQVIDTSGEQDATRRQVAELWRMLSANAG